jgi:hypothetical protein
LWVHGRLQLTGASITSAPYSYLIAAVVASAVVPMAASSQN